MKRHIPNTITLVNLFCGCGALVAVLHSQFILVAWFLLVAALADYLDGAVARLFGVNSPLGKELDSLADMVSFGVVPGAILYALLVEGWGISLESGVVWKAMPAFFLSVLSGLRLGKFNLDNRQEEHFLGLPTPASTVFVVGLMLVYEFDSYQWREFILNVGFLYTCVVVLSLLLISEIPMFHFKFKALTWKGNEIKLAFIVISIIALLLLREAAISLLILLYVLINLAKLAIRR